MSCCSKPYLFFALITFFASSLNISYCNKTRCPQIEKHALLSFKQSLDDPYDSLSSWNSKVDCCKWDGVVCNNLTGHVYELHLGNNDWFFGLRGKINSSLLNLKHLRHLDLSGFQFEGSIPSFIGSFERLEYLNLFNAGFNGSNPRFLGNLSNLRALNLGQLELDVDNLTWMSGLSRLERLDMSSVNLSKVGNSVKVINTFQSLVEVRLGSCSLNFIDHLKYFNISSLTILDLSWNNFRSCEVPGWIFQLSNLVYLDLGGNNFEGPIPISSNITKLWYLKISSNNFNSTIPDWLYSYHHLEYVDMSWNFLLGVVSSSIVNLTSLNILDLSYNKLNGRIPTELTKFCRLQTLDLEENYFLGDLSVVFQNMSDCFLGSLQRLTLRGNQLSGRLPFQFGKFRSLRGLDLGENSISGSIPFNIGDVSSLEDISLDSNKFTGDLPKSIGQLYSLSYFHIENNMLEGVVPEDHFANLTNLRDLQASRNHLTLRVNPNWIPPFRIDTLRLESWNLGGKIPSWLETQKDYLMELDLSNTHISGNIPMWVWEIRFLNLSHNQLSGEIPDIFGPEDGPRTIYLNSNKLSGSIPRVANTVTELEISSNSFSGGISHFLCDTTNETYRLEILDLGGNHLTGEIPDCLVKWPSLTLLNLGNNNMSGKIPKSIRHLRHLISLNIYSNRFSGGIPSAMKNCTSLAKIDLSDNYFSGNVPEWIGTSLSHIRILILRSNMFGGEISSDLCHLTFLQILDLSGNKISGAIPKCISNFTAMTTKRSIRYDEADDHNDYDDDDYDDDDDDAYFDFSYSYVIGAFQDSAYVSTKGRELMYDATLSLVTNIDFSSNNLSGNIPKEMTSLVELRSLNLSHNKLKGSIPERIGNMKQLESLDLSRNSLSGEIPDSFMVLSSLSYLNLSYNNLSGMIPQSTQISGMSASSFIGNNLCGPPLTKSCISDSPIPIHKDEVEDEDEEFDKWFYVFLSSGYAVGLFTFCAVLIINREWRESYYGLLEDIWNKVCVYITNNMRKIRR